MRRWTTLPAGLPARSLLRHSVASGLLVLALLSAPQASAAGSRTRALRDLPGAGVADEETTPRSSASSRLPPGGSVGQGTARVTGQLVTASDVAARTYEAQPRRLTDRIVCVLRQAGLMLRETNFLTWSLSVTRAGMPLPDPC